MLLLPFTIPVWYLFHIMIDLHSILMMVVTMARRLVIGMRINLGSIITIIRMLIVVPNLHVIRLTKTMMIRMRVLALCGRREICVVSVL